MRTSRRGERIGTEATTGGLTMPGRRRKISEERRIATRSRSSGRIEGRMDSPSAGSDSLIVRVAAINRKF